MKSHVYVIIQLVVSSNPHTPDLCHQGRALSWGRVVVESGPAGLWERFSENTSFLHIMLKIDQTIRPRTTICISLERAWFALQCLGIRFSIFHFIHLQLVCEKIILPKISHCKFCTALIRLIRTHSKMCLLILVEKIKPFPLIYIFLS